MNYPKKLEINIENDAQAALLYSCFNLSHVNVLEKMRESVNEKVRKMADYFVELRKDKTKETAAGDYVYSCWKKVADILHEVSVLPAGKKKNKDNIAKIVVEVNEMKKSTKILEFKNIKKKSELPSNYFLEFPFFYKTSDESFVVVFLKGGQKTHSEYNFYIGEMYDTKKFEVALLAMKEAGKRLTQINREEKQLSISGVVKEFTI